MCKLELRVEIPQNIPWRTLADTLLTIRMADTEASLDTAFAQKQR